MKRRLITSLYLSLAALAACQTESPTDTETVGQEVSSDCSARMPPIPVWDGQAFPRTGATEIYLFYQELGGSDWIMVRVDYGKGEIPFGVRTKTTGLSGMLSKLDRAAQFAGGRQPSPPQPVGDWSLPAALIEWARLAAPDLAGAGAGGVCRQ